MLEAARLVREFTKDVAEAAYLSDRKLQLAVERSLEIIGEAAGRVSPEFREAHPEIPWKGIVGQRNVLIHAYGEIQQERVWNVAAGMTRKSTAAVLARWLARKVRQPGRAHGRGRRGR